MPLFKVNPQQVRVILTQGIKRQVRRVFAALDYKVNPPAADPNRHDDRQGLRSGAIRFLSREEVLVLKGVSRPRGASRSR